MGQSNFLFYFGKISKSLVLDILFFPLWWYSFGLFDLAKNLFVRLVNKQKSLALTIWIKNIFVPMYGQNDLAGKLISFFMRIFQIIFRAFVLFFYFLFFVFIIIFWLAWPFFVFYQIWFSF